MKEENGYKINNPDGADRRSYGEGKTTFSNDSSRFIRERFDGVNETTRAKESFNSPEPKSAGRRSSDAVGKRDTSSTVSSRVSSVQDAGPASSLTSASGAAAGATATAATATATAATSVTAAVGGGVTAIAGVVTATVVTAVIVVTTFLAVLGVNLSLIMADYTSLTFRLELVTEGEGELEDPYYQAFISGNGVSKSMTVMAGDIFTFDGLEPDKEYLVTIKNGEGEVQVEQTFCTAAHPVQKGSLEVTLSGAVVSCLVKDVPLSSGAFYTVTAKDEKSNVLFVTDDVAPEKTFTFTLHSPTKFNVTLSVGGKIQAVEEKEWKEENEVPALLPDYDFDGGVWNWADYLNPTVAFPDKNGGDPLTISATVTRSEEAPGCEEDGVIRFFATASYEGRTFTDQKTQVVSAIGHDYVFMGFEWTPVYSADCAGNTGDEGGVHTSDAGSDGVQTGDEVPATIVGYTAAAVFVCSHDETHVVTVTEGVTVTSTDFSPTCEADAFRRFTASFTQEGETYTDTQDLVFEGTARGHDYSLSDPNATTEFDWTVEENGTCSAAYLVVTCANGCGKDLRVNAELGMESPDEEALCTRGGSITYYASVYYNENLYQDVKEVSVEALGHAYDSYLWIWAEDGGPYPYMEFTCSRCGEKDYCNATEVTQNTDGKYVATATYDGVTYTDVSDEVISMNDGTLFLRSYDYTQGEDVGATPFFGTNINRIVLTGSYTDEKPALEVYNFSDMIDGIEGRGDGSTIEFRIDFDNVDICVEEGGGSPIRIIATKNVVLFIENKGTSQLSYYNAPLITVEGDSECSVTVYVQSTNGFDGFVCTEQNDGWSYLFDADSEVPVVFYMNNDPVGFDGEPVTTQPIG